ncbi:nucleotidyltransferase domain-containing protein [Bacillus sp. ISL-47]|uniref:nucleotidyltransferase domain-containing protein n=1 Tax=Bacillus sp. ISL-47 TaxID=2819130 RepID=UPI001BEAE153|nr:nucleotidyltransferase domain-containing protein [Bacillus sp. ISL-47]MBT2690215.1 nucleotidyltransferase domain-containing protein [Bacillus sp. ISL-47]MBT2710336.1 nucleotidyltransferase domain-containing protein [Pseudomonas sp. ISL-84]
MKKIHAAETSQEFITRHFPACQAAVLAGSVIRGEETDTSDLDIVVFDSAIKTAYRESFIFFGWPIEVFVHNLDSYKDFFRNDAERARPSLPRMVAEGMPLKDSGILQEIKKEALSLLAKGPEAWTEETIRLKRYFITDAVDDLRGSSNRGEEIFIAGTLAELLSEFVLRTNRQWIGSSKWTARALQQYDPVFAEEFMAAFDIFYRDGIKTNIIELTEKMLEPHGGPLFEGFSLGK